MIKRMFLFLVIVSYNLRVDAFFEGWLKNTFKLYYQIKEMLQVKKPTYATLLNSSKTQSDSTKEDIEALSWAAGQEDDQDKVAQLLDKGVDVNAVDSWGDTPVQNAIYYKNEKMVEYLIKKKADLNKKNRNGHTPLMKAVSESDYCFNDKRDQTEIDTCRNTMLRIARMILKANTDIDAKTDDGYFTPLNLAIQNHDAEMVEVLLENGADIHIATYGNINAFDKALNFFDPGNPHCTKILRLLIEKGVDLNQKNAHFLPLGKISSEFVEYDYKSNAPINLDLVDFFIEKGADVNAQDKWGYSALDEICRVFKDMKQCTSPQKKVFLSLVKKLLKTGADCNYNNGEYRKFLLCWTIAEKDTESVAILIKNGANVNWNHTATKSGTTRPLHDACVAKDTQIIEMLLEAGADINAKDNNGKTIFDYAQTDTEINMVLQKHLEKIKNVSRIAQKTSVENPKDSEIISGNRQSKEDTNQTKNNIKKDSQKENNDDKIFIYNDF